MAEIEETIADFARAHRQTLDPQLSPIAGPRALLRAQLAELVSEHKSNSWRRLLHFTSTTRAAAFLCAVVLIATVVGRILVHHSTQPAANSIVDAFERGALPDRRLTPGATRRVAISDVCSMAHEEVDKEVSTSLRQEVFREYGIVNAHPDDYEVDYLIAPGLGGSERRPQPVARTLHIATVECARQGRLGRTSSRNGLWWSARFIYCTTRHLHGLDCGLQEVFPYGSTSRPALAPRINKTRFRADVRCGGMITFPLEEHCENQQDVCVDNRCRVGGRHDCGRHAIAMSRG